MRVFVLGFMGAGKSTFAKGLAEKISYESVDLDELIEARLKKSIRQIFETEGEAFFRAAESNCLIELGSRDNIVVACGGGTPCYNDNGNWILEHGKSIYLECSVPELTKRLESATELRPLLREEETLEKTITRMLRSRLPFYEAADITLSGEDPDVEVAVKALELLAQENEQTNIEQGTRNGEI